MNRIEKAKVLHLELEHEIEAVAYGLGPRQNQEKILSAAAKTIAAALPVIEAALAANPVTSIAVALGDTLTSWKETP